MQPHLPQDGGSRRASAAAAAAARPRVCVHCGRSFRRTEHLERHIRTHTKEKPFACFCGAAFTRRDLLKRHTRISHQEGLASPNRPASPSSQPDQETRERRTLRTRDNPAVQYPYDARTASRPDVPLQPPPTVEQWTGPRHGSYMENQGVIGTSGSDGALGTNHVSHDADMLEAAQLLLPTGYRDTSQSFPYIPGELNHFQDFTHFLDSIGLPAEWIPLEGGASLPNRAPEATPEAGRTVRDQHAPSNRAYTERTRADSPFRSWLPSVPPGDQSLGSISDHEPPQVATSSPLKVSEEQRLRLASSLDAFRHVIPGFVLPSRHTLMRYLASFFEGFDPHLPFIHVPTFRINDRSPELILGLLTVGAQYRFEYRNAERLFHAGKAIILERLSKDPHAQPSTSSSHYDSPRQLQEPVPPPVPSNWQQMENIRSLLALMGYATWEVRTDLLQEAFGLQSLLVRCLREAGLTESTTVLQKHRHLLWHEWAEEESIRRTKFIAFCFVHMHSVAYNVYPVLRSSEIHLRLPCSTAEWKARTASEWEAAQKGVASQQLFFQDALALLLQQSRTTTLLDPIPAPLGNYILLHGLLQRIHLVSELSLPNRDQFVSLPTEELNKLERALRSWTSVWQQAPESSLDPHNENGPIPFTSSSLLGLAYVRLSLNLGPYRQLETRDPYCIASSLYRSPRPQRSYRLTPALIYSAHALSIPVRLGIDHVARSQAFFWSVRHSLASLECAVLLSKWLLSLDAPGTDQNLSENESRILSWTGYIVQEAYDSMDLDERDALPNLEPSSLGFAVIKLWARLFCRNTQWPFINVLGQSLERYLSMILAG